MTGDLNDVVARLWSALPKRWFSEQSPNLNAVLTCIATPWVWLYDLILYVRLQTRLDTATENWLDLIGHDYLGGKIQRKPGEVDFVYRTRIQNALLQGAATRAAVSSGIEKLVGVKPNIFEPENCMDTGSYGALNGYPPLTAAGLAYGKIGGWGSLDLPLQFFISTVRPPVAGVGMLAGYGTSCGGYGEGSISYIDLSLLSGQVTDQDIQSTLSDLLPLNAIAWLRIN
jgi:hypothetical protein